MSDTREWILKLLSGPHQGAEVSHREGRLLIGSDPECDLVLHDVLVAPRHFALSLQGGKLTVEPIEGPLFCNGKRVTAATPVPPFAFLTAGTTHLVPGPAHERWPLLSAADAPALEPEPVATPSGSGEAASPRGPVAPTRDQRRRAWWTAGLGAAMLLAWVVLWFSLAPRESLLPAVDLRVRAEALLARFPEAGPLRLEEAGSGLTLRGYVAEEATHRELTHAFREELPEVGLRVWSSPRLLETARALLAERQAPLEVAPAANPGHLVVRGSLRTREEWTRLRQHLLSEVPGLQRLHEEIAFAPPVPARAPAPIAAAPVSAEAVLVVALQSLGDGQGWIRLSDGRVLFRGGRVGADARLVEVEPDRAIVERGGARYALAVGASLADALRQPLMDTSEAAAPSAAPMVARQTDHQNG